MRAILGTYDVRAGNQLLRVYLDAGSGVELRILFGEEGVNACQVLGSSEVGLSRVFGGAVVCTECANFSHIFCLGFQVGKRAGRLGALDILPACR